MRAIGASRDDHCGWYDSFEWTGGAAPNRSVDDFPTNPAADRDGRREFRLLVSRSRALERHMSGVRFRDSVQHPDVEADPARREWNREARARASSKIDDSKPRGAPATEDASESCGFESGDGAIARWVRDRSTPAARGAASNHAARPSTGAPPFVVVDSDARAVVRPRRAPIAGRRPGRGRCGERPARSTTSVAARHAPRAS